MCDSVKKYVTTESDIERPGATDVAKELTGWQECSNHSSLSYTHHNMAKINEYSYIETREDFLSVFDLSKNRPYNA